MSTFKKSLSLVLALLMLISVFTVVPLTAGAAETHKRHTKANTEKKPTGDYTSGDYKYYLNDDGTADITEYTGSDKDLVIPGILDEHKVVCIWSETFEDCDFIENIEIPDSVTYIDSNVFADTAYYKNDDNWENGVLYIGKFLIKARNMTGTYTVKPGTTVIAGDAFYEYYYNEETDEETYSNLQGVVIPSSVTHIGLGAFNFCDKLTSVTLSNGLKYIGEYAFYSCKSLKSITIPDSVAEIDECAFEDCYSLENVTLPSGISTISYRLFTSCENLNSINIPSSVTSIGEDAFYDTGYYNNDANWENNVLYIGKYLIKSRNMTGTYTIKPGTTVIAGDAFFEYYHNEETDEVTYSNLQGVVIPSSVTHIGYCAFEYCDKLKNVTLSDGLNYIGEYAFDNCTALKSISIPNSVTTIESYTFYDCTSLENVTIPNSVKEICANAFYNTGIYNNPSNWTNGVLYIGKYLIAAKPDVITGSYTVKSGTEVIGRYAFLRCEGITSITIPDSVKYINSFAFYECRNLKSVTIGKNVKEIGYRAFSNTALKSVTIPANVIYIAQYAFGYNTHEIIEEEFREYIDNEVPSFTINGYAGTAAEKYASANGFKFVKLTPPKKVKQANTLKVSAKTKAVKAKKLKKKKQTVKPLTIKNAKGAVTVTKVKKGSAAKLFKKITVNKKTGAITIKKGKYAKKTYKIKLKITAKGNSSYNSKTLTKVVKIKVK